MAMNLSAMSTPCRLSSSIVPSTPRATHIRPVAASPRYSTLSLAHTTRIILVSFDGAMESATARPGHADISKSPLMDGSDATQSTGVKSKTGSSRKVKTFAKGKVRGLRGQKKLRKVEERADKEDHERRYHEGFSTRIYVPNERRVGSTGGQATVRRPPTINSHPGPNFASQRQCGCPFQGQQSQPTLRPRPCLKGDHASTTTNTSTADSYGEFRPVPNDLVVGAYEAHVYPPRNQGILGGQRREVPGVSHRGSSKLSL